MSPQMWAGIALAILTVAVWAWVSTLAKLGRRVATLETELERYRNALIELGTYTEEHVKMTGRLRGRLARHQHSEVSDAMGHVHMIVTEPPHTDGDGDKT